MIKLLSFSVFTIALFAAIPARAVEVGSNFANCTEIKDRAQKYDFFKMDGRGADSFFVTAQDKGEKLLVGSPEEVRYEDGGKALFLRFGPVSFLLRKGHNTKGATGSYGDVKDMTCNADW